MSKESLLVLHVILETKNHLKIKLPGLLVPEIETIVFFVYLLRGGRNKFIM